MNKQIIKEKIQQYANKIAIALKKLSPRSMLKFIKILGSSWRIIAAIFFIIIFLYYPLGGWLVNDIDTDTSVEVTHSDENRSYSVEMVSYLIRREVNDKIWTPNLPFFFPSYFLDNMPEFQLGLIKGLSSFTQSLAKKLEPNIASEEEHYLKEAANLLQYDPTIWMFSSQSKLVPVPSAHSQYRKARKLLVKYNQKLSDGSLTLYKTPQDLHYFLNQISHNLVKTSSKLEAHIREESMDIIDNQSDNLLFYSRGLAYANYMLLKALAVDYKSILLEADVYPEWTKLLKALENASTLNPLIVRNGELNSSSAPNHLTTEGFYLLKAHNILQNINHKLEYKFLQLKDQQ